MTNTLQAVLAPPNTEWTEDQWQTFRSWIVDHLKASAISVTFTKKDGTVRVMKCTLSSEIIPAQPLHESNTDSPVNFPKVKKENLNIVSAYDIEAGAWRSFTLKNVTNVSFDL